MLSTYEDSRDARLDARLKEVDKILASDKTREEKIKSFRGILSEYARPDLVELEKEAWPRAAVERYIRSHDIA